MNAVLTYLDTGDRRVSDRFADWSPPRWFRFWMLSATRLGDGWLWAFVALGLLATADYGVLAAASLGLQRRQRRHDRAQEEVSPFPSLRPG